MLRSVRLDLETGTLLWHHTPLGAVFTVGCHETDGINYWQNHAVESSADQKNVQGVWLDPATGTVLSTTVIDQLNGAFPVWRTLLVDATHTWVAFSRDGPTGKRELVKLTESMPNDEGRPHDARREKLD